MSTQQATAVPAFVIPATSHGSAPQLPQVEPEGEAPAVVIPPLPTKTALQRFGETPHGEAAKLWCNCAGAVLGYVTPLVALTAGGVAVCGMPGARGLQEAPVVAGLVGGVLTAAFQAKDMGHNVQLYKDQGHPHPRLASFRDVMALFVAPAVATELAVGYSVGPEAGFVSGLIAAFLCGSYAITANVVHRKHVAAKANG